MKKWLNEPMIIQRWQFFALGWGMLLLGIVVGEWR